MKPPEDSFGIVENSSLGRGKFKAILFAEDVDEPHLIQVNTLKGYKKSDFKLWRTINLRPHLPDDEKRGRAMTRLYGAPVPHKPDIFPDAITLGPMLDVFYRKNFYSDGSKRNRCIERLTDGTMHLPWSGSFIVLRWTHADKFEDAIIEEDLPMLKKFFTTGENLNL